MSDTLRASIDYLVGAPSVGALAARYRVLTGQGHPLTGTEIETLTALYNVLEDHFRFTASRLVRAA
jgi:hypothetical protein